VWPANAASFFFRGTSAPFSDGAGTLAHKV
jgi:hypothetical protein